MAAPYCSGVHLLDLALPVVNPDLDDVDFVRREFLYRLAGFRLGIDLERGCPGSIRVMPLPALK